MLKEKRAPLAPWERVAKAIRRQEITPLAGMVELLGEERAGSYVDTWRRAKLREVASEERRISPKTGTAYAPPRTATVPLSPAPVRGADSAPVRDMAILCCRLMRGLKPGKHRTGGAGLYVGDPTGHRAAGLGSRLMDSRGRPKSNREIDRFLAVFRDHEAGPRAWQPSRQTAEANGLPISKLGRVYNVYEWGQLPDRLVAVIEDWWRQLVAHGKRAGNVLKVAPTTEPAYRPRDKQTADGASFAAALLAKLEPPS